MRNKSNQMRKAKKNLEKVVYTKEYAELFLCLIDIQNPELLNDLPFIMRRLGLDRAEAEKLVTDYQDNQERIRAREQEKGEFFGQEISVLEAAIETTGKKVDWEKEFERIEKEWINSLSEEEKKELAF